MARTYRSQFLAIQRQSEARMTALFGRLAAVVGRDVLAHADADGMVSVARTYELQRAAGERVTGLFLGRVSSGERAPLTTLPDGKVLPLSPYAMALWGSIVAATRLGVEQHAAMLARRLPPDMIAMLGGGGVREQAGVPTIRPNPLATYAPPHLWVDPGGYTLSERIWRVAGDTRRRLDAFLDERVRQGQGALAMSRDLERFLQPGRTLRTRAPYGADASYDAMRLARTEITRAHAQASEVAAALNPFVWGMGVVLSPSHPKYDICDVAAAAGPWPKGEIPAQYQIPLHPHCLCRYEYVMVEDPAAVLEAYCDEVRAARVRMEEMLNPLAVERLVALLLGTGLRAHKAEVAV